MTAKRTNIEIIAPSVEEAIADGLAQLGLPEDQVEIEILDEGTKGLFGIGSRQTRVRLTIKGEAAQTEITADTPAEVDAPPEWILGLDDEDEAEDQVLRITRETVAELLEKMKITAEVTARHADPEEDDRGRPPICVDIHGDDLSILIGRKTETLDALQYIAKLIIGKEVEQSTHLVVDVEGFRLRRERQIRQLAQTLAEQVSKSGRSQPLEPMPPNERRFVHIELRDDPDVYTESVGEGNRRKVVIHSKE
jgi:spoIIIJ-associated protein